MQPQFNSFVMFEPHTETARTTKSSNLLLVLFAGFVDVTVDKRSPGFRVTAITTASSSTGKQLMGEREGGEEKEKIRRKRRRLGEREEIRD